ncbi:histidine phosphatase family protein [Streptomyces cupreus]|uniref:Histidine phosphatase family protein n=1 Tax=Streptomyces cupreus TaxID=2759956 RepID=A0A7X1J719_9ACTN|nr:histidine phosphatase family protein [Streptomyces cupreus]
MADPASAPHGGESVRDFCDRIVESAERLAGRTVVVVDPEAVRAAVVRALGAPESAFWRIDVPPLTSTEFSGRSGRWNLRIGQPLGGAQSGTGRLPEPS